MSKAFKCDRCKKCFDPWMKGLEFGRIENYTSLVPTPVGQLGTEFDAAYRDDDIHLCPRCNTEFANFMNPLKDTELGDEIEIFVGGKRVATYVRKNRRPFNEKDGV